MRIGTRLRFGSLSVEDDAGVEGRDAVGCHQERIHVQLRNRRVFRNQIRKSHQDFHQPVDVHCLSAAETVQQRFDAKRIDHATGQAFVERRQFERAVAEHFGRDAPGPNHHHGAEDRILLGADDQLDSFGRSEHRLYGDAVNVGVRPQSFGAFDHVVENLLHFLIVRNAQDHALHFGLVQDLRRVDLHHDRVADFASDLHGSTAEYAGCGIVVGMPNDVSNAFDSISVSVSRPAASASSICDARGVRVHGSIQRHLARRFVQDFAIASIRDQIHKCTHGTIRRIIRRNAGLIEDLSPGLHGVSAHPRRQDRFASRCGNIGHANCRAHRIGHRLRREHDQHAIDIWIGDNDFQCFGESIGPGVAQHIDRILMRPMRGQHALSLSIVSGESLASCPCRSSNSSAAITPGPPALVMMANRGPAGVRWRANSSAQSNMSSAR